MSKTPQPLRPRVPGAPCLYVLIGPPGSGKSTWVGHHLSTVATPTHIASTDDVLERLAKEHGSTYGEMHATRFKEAEREFKAEMIEAARLGRDIVVDRTNMGSNARRKLFALIDSSSKQAFTRIAVVFDLPDDVLRARLDERAANTGKHISPELVAQMRRDFVAPTYEEFHFIKEGK